MKPSAYVLTDGSWFGKKGYKKVEGKGTDEYLAEKAIFATAISKYVLKLGRLTVHPEVCLDASGLLPERPGGWAKMQGEEEGGLHPLTGEVRVEREGNEWDWRRVVEENERGLKFAENFAALDELHGEFSGGKTAALGKYRDFLYV